MAEKFNLDIVPNYINVIEALQSPKILDIASNPDLSTLITDFTPKLLDVAKASKDLLKNVKDDYEKSIRESYIETELDENFNTTEVRKFKPILEPLTEEESKFDENGDGILNDEEKAELRKSKIINTFISSLDNQYFKPKYNITFQQIIDFKELPKEEKNKEIKKYALKKSGLELDSNQQNQIQLGIDSAILLGKEIFKLFASTKRKTIRGKIVDSSTNKPIKGALVKYYPSLGEEFDYHQDITGIRGKFSIEIDPLDIAPLKPQNIPATENVNLFHISGEIIPNGYQIVEFPTAASANKLGLDGYKVYVSEDEYGTPSKPSYEIAALPRLHSRQTQDDNNNPITTYYYLPAFELDIPQNAKFLTAKKGNKYSTLFANEKEYEFSNFITTLETVDVIFKKPDNITIIHPKYVPLEIIPFNGDGTVKRKLGILKMEEIKLNTSYGPLKTDVIKKVLINKEDANYYTQEKLNQLYRTLKTDVIPPILTMLFAFGVSKGIEAIQSNKKPKGTSCPDQTKLLQIIKNKNQVVKGLNRAFRTIETSTKIVNTGLTVINVLNVSLQIVKNIPIPTSVPPGVGIPINVITKISETIAKTEQTLVLLQNIGSGILAILVLLRTLIQLIISLLNLLDGLIQECAQSTPELATVFQEQLSNELINFGSLSSNTSNNQSLNEINGFIMGTETEITTNPLKRRRATAKNKNGIILLFGEFSFTSIDQILIDELIFYIQTNDLKAD